jgi:hypothetical protein
VVGGQSSLSEGESAPLQPRLGGHLKRVLFRDLGCRKCPSSAGVYDSTTAEWFGPGVVAHTLIPAMQEA